MKTYEVNYLEGTEKKTAYIQGANEVEAGKEFSRMNPNVSADDLISVMDAAKSNSVAIADINVPFWSMILFMVKAAIAFIPAFIILFVIGSLIMAVFGGLFGGMGHL